MPFTDSSPVRKILLRTRRELGDSAFVQFEYLEGAEWIGELAESAGATTDANSIAYLATLQRKYAAGTLVDNLGNAVAIEIEGAPFDDVEDLEKYGFENPLIPGSRERLIAGRRIRGLHMQRGEVTDADLNAGTPDTIEIKAGVEPRPVIGPGRVNLAQWLADIGSDHSAGAIFALDLYIEEEDGVTIADLDDHPAIAAMRSWLTSRKATADAAVAGDADAAASWTGRTFEARNSDGTAAFNFRVNSLLIFTSRFTVPTGDDAVIHFGLVCQRVSGGDYDREVMSGDLDRYIVLSTNTKVETVTGHRETPLVGSRVAVGEVVFRGMNGLPEFEATDPDSAIPRIVPYGSHGIVDFENMTDVVLPIGPGNANRTVKRLPSLLERRMVNEIHFRKQFGRGDGIYETLKLPRPTDATFRPGTVRPLRIDNQGGSPLSILDWNNNEVVLLYQGETVSLRFVSDLEGGGRLLSDPIVRRWEKHALNPAGGFDGASGGAYFDYDTLHWARIPNVPTPNIRFHNDAFATGGAALPQSADWSAANVDANAWTVSVLRPGHLTFRQTVQLRLSASSTGSIPSGARVVTYRKRNNVLQRVSDQPINEPVSAAINRALLVWRFDDEAEADDLYVPIWIFAKSATLSGGTGTIGTSLFSRSASLEYTLSVEE